MSTNCASAGTPLLYALRPLSTYGQTQLPVTLRRRLALASGDGVDQGTVIYGAESASARSGQVVLENAPAPNAD
jgi:hypothetical protein